MAGIVVDASTHLPRAGARLAIMLPGARTVAARQTTGADGLFSFDLPAGKYKLMSGDPNDPQLYGVHAAGMAGSALCVGPGQQTSALIFRWTPAGAISGRIVDEFGEPVEAASIQLVQSVIRGGRLTADTLAWTYSDDRGEYRFAPLPGGTFYLAVTATPWRPLGQASDSTYVPVFYPDSPQPAGAAPLTPKPGEEVRADFTLHAVPGANMEIRTNSTQPATGTLALLQQGIGASESYLRNVTVAKQPYILNAVPPGHYLIRLAGTSNGLPVFGQRTVDVNGTEVYVTLPLRQMATVSGTVRFAEPGVRPRSSLMVSLYGTDTADRYNAAVHDDGGFSIPRVAPGKYRFSLFGNSGFFAREIQVEGAPYGEGTMEVREDQTPTVRILASNETGRVTGVVMNGDQTVEGANVVLAPAHPGDGPAGYSSYETDSDGSYDFQRVPAGDYLLFAVDDFNLEFANPSTLRPYLPQAKAIQVKAGGEYSNRIPLLKPSADK